MNRSVRESAPGAPRRSSRESSESARRARPRSNGSRPAGTPRRLAPGPEARGGDQRRILAAVAHASRFEILLQLAERERYVSELADAIGLSQSCTTRHLQALERAGVVLARRAGKRVVARLELGQPILARLLAWIQSAPALPVSAGGAPGRRRAQPAAAHGSGRGIDRPRDPAPEDRAHAPEAGSDTSAPEPDRAASGSTPRFSDIEDFLL